MAQLAQPLRAARNINGLCVHNLNFPQGDQTMIDKDLPHEPMRNQTPSAPPSDVDPQEPDPSEPKTGLLGGEDAFERSLGSRRRRQSPVDETDEA